MMQSLWSTWSANKYLTAVAGLALAGVLVAGFVGCGGPTIVEVTGKVTYNGEPLPAGTVMFQPVGGEHSQPSTGEIQPDGTFKLTTREEGEGATVGTNRVLINSYEPTDDAAGGEATVGKSRIPSKYTRYGTSGLTVEVKPGMEPVLLELNDER